MNAFYCYFGAAPKIKAKRTHTWVLFMSRFYYNFIWLHGEQCTQKMYYIHAACGTQSVRPTLIHIHIPLGDDVFMSGPSVCVGTQTRRATHVVFGGTRFAFSFYALSTSQSAVSFFVYHTHLMRAHSLYAWKSGAAAKRKIHLLLHRNQPARRHQITH